VLKSDILAGGNSGPYDLFLAADYVTPKDLVDNHSSLILNYPSGNVPFHYTTGSLVLWSDTVNTIGGGLPNPLDRNFVIADPSTAPYGYAAIQVMNSLPWNPGFTKSTTFPAGPSNYVNTATNIDTTYAAVANHTYDYGFVAKSKVCQKYGTPPTEHYSGVSHHEYVYNDPSTPYDELVQYGVGIDITGRSGAATQLVKDFIDYLLTDTDARAIIDSYCYQ
jgi:molybdate transport system substrate-binding protein